MTSKTTYTHRISLFFALCFSLNFSIAQCGPLTMDSIGNPGEYIYAELTESDGIRNGPDYNGATIYYPVNASPPFTGMAIVPGYVSPQSSIQAWGPFLASHGIVTMTIGTNSIYEYPEDRRDALLDALITLKEENTRAGSPLLGNIDINSLAVGGWSMGGGGAQLAAVADPSLKAVMALCPWLNPSSLNSGDLDHAVPLLIFSGENDGIAPHASHADVHYDYTPSTTQKMLFEIASGNHSVANDPSGGGEFIGKIAVSWLNNFLVGDTCYCPLVLNTPPTASKYLLNVECSAVLASVDEGSISQTIGFQLYPNPTNGIVKLEVDKLGSGTNYQIFSTTGAKVDHGEVYKQTTAIDLRNLEAGIYIFTLINAESSSQTRIIVQ